MLTFNEEEHRYFWRGREVPSVTQALKVVSPTYGFVDPEQLEIARQKGVAVHKMIELFYKGEAFHVPEWLQPIYTKFLRFIDETGFEVIRSEYRVYHELYQYAGTLDLFGTMQGKAVFIDVKRSFMAGRAIGMQLEAYRRAYCAQEKVGEGNALRFGLRLHENGNYKLEPYNNPNDWQAFLACLTVHRLKKENGL
jgi:hypothetical protein